jgi:hypothetical protein
MATFSFFSNLKYLVLQFENKESFVSICVHVFA